MAKITFFETRKETKEYLQEKLKEHDLKFFNEPLTKENVELAKDAEILSVFIYSKVTKEVIDNIPNLKQIATRSTGFDHIDIKVAKEKNIPVCNVPFYGENTVAEHTFALILALSRKVHKSYLRCQKDDFSNKGLTGFDLRGKTIGIIGGGHIGMHVAKIAKGFSMEVKVFDPLKQNFLADVVGFTYVTFEELLKKSDIVSLHVPYNQKTKHLINENTIKLMKETAYIINTARGGLIEIESLFEALKSKKIAGAGLDVIEGEELILEESQLLHNNKNMDKLKSIMCEHDIFKMDNVVFTPHNAFNSTEAIYRILDTTISNIRNLEEKKNAQNCINN